jgi:Zn-dependent protease
MGFVALRIGLAAGFFGHPGVEAFQIDRLVQATAEGSGWQDGLGRFLSVLLVLNVALFLFNLIPFPPMDGASVLSGFFRPARRLQETLLSSPFASLIGLVVAWALFPRIYGPVLGWVLHRLYS